MILTIANGVGAVVLAGIGGTYGFPMAVRLAEVRMLRRLTSQRRTLVLTYDDGPGSELTSALLPMLASHSVKATFFLLGVRAIGAPEMVMQLRDQGHELGCHTMEHKHAWKTWPSRTLSDMSAGYESLKSWIGPNAVFRPPYGKLCMPTWRELRRRNRPIAWWTIDSCDTHPTLPTPQSIADSLARTSGGVVLLHDFDRQQQRTCRAKFVLQTTELLLQTAQREGLNVCRFGDLWNATNCNNSLLGDTVSRKKGNM